MLSLPKPLFFVGSARRDLHEFPEEVQDAVGGSLQRVQWGATPHNAKPLRGFGGGVTVMEIAERYDTDTYRAVYTARFSGAVYVLHCFQKKSRHGIATPQQDIELIKARLAKAREMFEQQSENR